MPKLTQNISAQGVKNLKEFTEEIVQRELESKIKTDSKKTILKKRILIWQSLKSVSKKLK